MIMHSLACKSKKVNKDTVMGLCTALIFLTIILLTGCATPIGTRPAQISHTYEQISRNAVRTDAYSDLSAQVLHRFFLEDMFGESPGEAIAALHDIASRDNRRELLYTLSELAYVTAKQRGNVSGDSQRAATYYLASAVYAYFYLFDQDSYEAPGLYDRRIRFACDLYNAALAQVMALHRENKIQLTGMHKLPVGAIDLEMRHDHFPYALKNIETFIPADKVSVYGLSVRDRLPGLGAPFIAVEKKMPDRPAVRSFPGTLFLRIEGDIRKLKAGARGQIELYSSYEKRTVAVNGQSVPLEKDLSAQLAYNLNQEFFWDMGSLQFMKGPIVKNGIYPLQPYAPGRTPVVFVHGTFSSPVWWAEMINTLRADPVLWNKYQFWCYLYDSGKAIVLSSTNLRDELSKMRIALDPEGKDQTLDNMVVVGHSQGGLLTKLTAVETGDKLIRSVTGKSIDELNLDETEKEMVQKYMIYSPLPFVRRVVFISTPHRGSYLAKGWVRNLLHKIISLPANLVKKTQALAHAAEDMGISGEGKTGEFSTSLDSMSPENPGLIALADIPLAQGITGHSIIPIKGDEQPPEGEDGVVKYTSAHIDYAESEFIVRDEHSCQSHPLVIEEVRRILIKHINQPESSQ